MAAKESLVLNDIFGGENTQKKRATAQIPRAEKEKGLKRVPRVQSRLSRSRKFIRDLQGLLEDLSKLLKTLRQILVRLIGLISVLAGAASIAYYIYTGKPLSLDVIIPALRVILRH